MIAVPVLASGCFGSSSSLFSCSCSHARPIDQIDHQQPPFPFSLPFSFLSLYLDSPPLSTPVSSQSIFSSFSPLHSLIFFLFFGCVRATLPNSLPPFSHFLLLLLLLLGRAEASLCGAASTDSQGNSFHCCFCYCSRLLLALDKASRHSREFDRPACCSLAAAAATAAGPVVCAGGTTRSPLLTMVKDGWMKC